MAYHLTDIIFDDNFYMFDHVQFCWVGILLYTFTCQGLH